MFNSYVKLPEGNTQKPAPPKTSQGSLTLDIDALLQLQLDSKWSTEAFPGQDSKIWIYLDVAPIKQMSTGTGTYIYQIIQFFLHGFHHAAYMIQEMYGYAWKVMQNPSESSSGSGVSHLKKWPPKDHNGYSLFYLSSEKTSTNQTEVGKRTFFDMGKKLIHYCWCFTSGLHKGLSIMHQHSSQEGDMKLNFNWLVERKNRRK